MATQRQYEAATVFNSRIVDMRHLWNPSNEYLGQPTQKPNYFGTFLVPKTQGHWSNEPVFASVMAAFGKLLQGQLQGFAANPNAVMWPIADGDMPSPAGKSSEFAKGHWLYSASTGNPPKVELVQAGGSLVTLPGRAGVKPGDYCMTGLTAAVKKNDARGVKFYLNGVFFSAPGQEIVFANSVSGEEMLKQAQAQGMHVTGFQGGGGFGAPQGGFPGAGQPQGFGAPQQQSNWGASQGQPQGFGQPQQGAPGFTPPAGFPGTPQGQPQGFAPPNTGNGVFGAAPGHGGTPNGYNGNATFPSNGFVPPQGPFSR